MFKDEDTPLFPNAYSLTYVTEYGEKQGLILLGWLGSDLSECFIIPALISIILILLFFLMFLFISYT